MADGEVTIYDAVYRSVEPYNCEEELREVFQVNGKECGTVGTFLNN